MMDTPSNYLNMNSLTALISNRPCSNIPLVTCSEHSNNRYSPKYMYLPAIYEPSNRNRYNGAFAQSHKYGFLKQNHSNVGNQAQHRHHFPRQDSAKSVKWPYLTTSNCSWSWPRRCCCSCSPRTSCQRRRKRPPQCWERTGSSWSRRPIRDLLGRWRRRSETGLLRAVSLIFKDMNSDDIFVQSLSPPLNTGWPIRLITSLSVSKFIIRLFFRVKWHWSH